MAIDFTYDNYERLLRAIHDRQFHTVTANRYLTGSRPHRAFLLRHDVEYDAARALRIAEMEAEVGLCATYYFHGPHRRVFAPAIMQTLSQLGHEVGYHYECLDRARGDSNRAYEMFRSDVQAFRSAGLEIRTVSAHGNPRIFKIGRAHV